MKTSYLIIDIVEFHVYKGVLDTAVIHNNSKVFLQSFDKAVRLRQMHEKNKLEMNSQGVNDFFELNMIQGPRAKSALSIAEYSNQKPRRESFLQTYGT